MSRAKLSSSLLTRRAALAATVPADVFETAAGADAGHSDLAFSAGKSNHRSGLVLRLGIAFCGAAAVAAAVVALFMHPTEHSAVTMAQRAESVTPDTTPSAAAGTREPSPITAVEMAEPRQAAPVPAAAPAPTPQITAEEIATLLASGEAALRTGDITTARLYFERATEAENPQAALRLGNTYDPAFLAMAGLKGVHSDAAVAERWYRYAQALGSAEATTALASLVGNDDVSNTPNAMNTLFEQFLSRTGKTR